MFGGTLTAYAFGYDPFAAVARWNDEHFWFEKNINTSIYFSLYHKLFQKRKKAFNKSTSKKSPAGARDFSSTIYGAINLDHSPPMGDPEGSPKNGTYLSCLRLARK